MQKVNNNSIRNTSVGEGTRIFFPTNIYDSLIGSNCLIGTFVQIENAKIGNNCKIHSFSYICKFVTIEDDVFIAHGVMFTNSRYPQIPSQWQKEIDGSNVATVVKKGASIGANATILPGVTIGDKAMVGAGSVVTKDISPNVIAYGNPCHEVRGRGEND
ncbi:MAG: N-acetyltransferase [Methanomicrobia archaeon]|nr:N-acetyltransferase [Methanomicrobia archaeon]